jgi:hypothetical protein
MADTGMYPTSPVEGERFTVVVQANQGWQSSSIELRAGDTVFMEAQGQWTVDVVTWPMSGPNGYQGGLYLLPLVCPDQAIGVLCFRIGSGPGFRAGKQVLIPEVSDNGALSFVCNERAGDWGNNAGSMTVTVIVRRSAASHQLSGRAGTVSCDFRIIHIPDGSVVASAGGEVPVARISDLTKAAARRFIDLRVPNVTRLSLPMIFR